MWAKGGDLGTQCAAGPPVPSVSLLTTVSKLDRDQCPVRGRVARICFTISAIASLLFLWCYFGGGRPGNVAAIDNFGCEIAANIIVNKPGS